MPKFYFTYAREAGYPFEGGWTEVEAPTLSIALGIFDEYHPKWRMDDEPFEHVLSERNALETAMLSCGHHGAYCQERIRIVREVFAELEGRQ